MAACEHTEGPLNQDKVGALSTNSAYITLSNDIYINSCNKQWLWIYTITF